MSDEAPTESIRESPVHLCIASVPPQDGVIGKGQDLLQDLFGVCSVVQNLFLATRAEGLGVTWVAMPRAESLRPILGIPSSVMPLAYLCLGYPGPTAQTPGREIDLDVREAIYFDNWGVGEAGEALLRRLQDRRALE